jgi:GT2 family glycosyltransferase
MNTPSLCVLVGCHNRRDKTVRALKALASQTCLVDVKWSIFVVDDGSSDGTTEAVLSVIPEAHMFLGPGNLYWGGAMRMVFAAALQQDFDFYLWLNDDTVLYPDALERLFQTRQWASQREDRPVIVVGSTQDAHTGATTYGGLVAPYRWRPMHFVLVEPEAQPEPCSSMNGNCVLISRDVAQRVGNLDPVFTHSGGDVDYGLRARGMGCGIWAAGGFLGTCSANSEAGTWADVHQPLRDRLRGVLNPKGLPPREWRVLVSRHCGPLWPVYWASPYVRLVATSLRGRGRQQATARRPE